MTYMTEFAPRMRWGDIGRRQRSRTVEERNTRRACTNRHNEKCGNAHTIDRRHCSHVSDSLHAFAIRIRSLELLPSALRVSRQRLHESAKPINTLFQATRNKR